MQEIIRRNIMEKRKAKNLKGLKVTYKFVENVSEEKIQQIFDRIFSILLKEKGRPEVSERPTCTLD